MLAKHLDEVNGETLRESCTDVGFRVSVEFQLINEMRSEDVELPLKTETTKEFWQFIQNCISQ